MGDMSETAVLADPLWWLHFDDGSVIVVQAARRVEAIVRTNRAQINPGVNYRVHGPLPPALIDPQWRDRLLSEDEAREIPLPGDLARG